MFKKVMSLVFVLTLASFLFSFAPAVEAATLESVSIYRVSEARELVRLNHTKTPAVGLTGTFAYAWSSSDNSIATVTGNDGQAEVRPGTRAGTATITLEVTQILPGGGTITKNAYHPITVEGSDDSSGGCSTAGSSVLLALLALPWLFRRKK